MGIPLLDARAAQRGIPLLDAETRHQRGIPLLDAKTQWNMHGQQDVRGISHWFCDAKTCCWLNTGFFGAKIVKSSTIRDLAALSATSQMDADTRNGTYTHEGAYMAAHFVLNAQT